MGKANRDANKADGGCRPEWMIGYLDTDLAPAPIHGWRCLGDSWSASDAGGIYFETGSGVEVLLEQGGPAVVL